VPPLEDRRGAPPGHRQGNGRLDGQLRWHDARADGPARQIPEPPRERVERHRGRHGDEHPAAQPAGSRRRAADAHREPGRGTPGPVQPGRRSDPRARLPHGRHPVRRRRRRGCVQGGSRAHPDPGDRPRRGGGPRQGADRDHRDPVHGQQGGPRRVDRLAREVEEDRGRRGPSGRERPGGNADRPRAEAGRGRGRRPEPTVPPHADGADVRRDQPRPRRRPAEDPQPEGDAPIVRRLPDHDRAAPDRLRPSEGPRARAYRRRPHHRGRPHRRGDSAHPPVS